MQPRTASHIDRTKPQMKKSLILAAALVPALAFAGPAGRLAPLPREVAVSSHAPFESGECGTCHQREDASNPGALVKPLNALCYDCHDEFKQRGGAPKAHPVAKTTCTTCHSPHNSKKPKLRL